MRQSLIISLALVGCAQSPTASLEQARGKALRCIERQVPDGLLVSAARALSIVEGCESDFEDWTRSLVEHVFKKTFDANDAKMVEAYNRELSDKIELMQLRISNGPHQDLPAI